MIVRTDLDHKRADKLARKNPKKERVRPVPASLTTPQQPMGSGPSPVPAAPEAAPQADLEPADAENA
jgi:hypothetical protein